MGWCCSDKKHKNEDGKHPIRWWFGKRTYNEIAHAIHGLKLSSLVMLGSLGSLMFLIYSLVALSMHPTNPQRVMSPYQVTCCAAAIFAVFAFNLIVMTYLYMSKHGSKIALKYRGYKNGQVTDHDVTAGHRFLAWVFDLWLMASSLVNYIVWQCYFNAVEDLDWSATVVAGGYVYLIYVACLAITIGICTLNSFMAIITIAHKCKPITRTAEYVEGVVAAGLHFLSPDSGDSKNKTGSERHVIGSKSS